MPKRAATYDLNHTNWDKEDEPEEAGVFQTTSSDILETRVIKVAKRHGKMSVNNSESKPSPFSGFRGFGKTTSTSSIGSTFSFLKSLDSGSKNDTGQDNASKLTNDTQPNAQTFTSLPFSNVEKEKDNVSPVLPGSVQENTVATDNNFKPFEHIFKSTKPLKENDNKSQNLELLRDLNLSCSKWISDHLDKNPYCILSPIFKDYEKHLAELDFEVQTDSKENKIESENQSTTNNSATDITKSLNPNKEESTDSNKVENEADKSKDFKIEGMHNIFGTGTPFGGSLSTPFNINQIAANPIQKEGDLELKKDDKEAEEPPKNDFVPVLEEDSIYDIKCKVFVKKDSSFVSRGVGTLFLKPVKDSNKTQAVVRAHTSLGNILLNILLTPGMPIQKTGKNNAMIVCIPTPEAKPPPVPVLIRVKTSEECDTLIKKLEECQGS